jgi:hypothetical protein
VQVESSAPAAQAVFWVPSRATNPNHHASAPLPPAGSVAPRRMLEKIAAAALRSSYLAARTFSRSGARRVKAPLGTPLGPDGPPCPAGTGVWLLIYAVPSGLLFLTFTGRLATAQVQREIRLARYRGCAALSPATRFPALVSFLPSGLDAAVPASMEPVVSGKLGRDDRVAGGDAA